MQEEKSALLCIQGFGMYAVCMLLLYFYIVCAK